VLPTFVSGNGRLAVRFKWAPDRRLTKITNRITWRGAAKNRVCAKR
jgi:hypothetical protein